MKVYKGRRLEPEKGTISNVEVTVNGKPLRHRVYHSPTGFNFGYGGSGPADLACRKIHRKNTLEVFTCQVCGKGYYEKVFYRSKNLCYICRGCVDMMKNELTVLKNRKLSGYYREMAKKFLSH